MHHSTKTTIRIGLVQEYWTDNPQEHRKRLAVGIAQAASKGAQLVCLQELTLSPYFCTQPGVNPKPYKENLQKGPTAQFVGEMARKHGVWITASLFEDEGSGYNTAVAFDMEGNLSAVTRKQHIPSGEKYHEDHYFQAGDSNYPIHTLAGIPTGLPTCYDQWFPELSRIYSLKKAALLIYPTAIGSEPTALEVDTQPLWQQVIVAQGIMSNTFMVAVNRVGTEDGLEFYGSSFISDPFGRILAIAPRNEPAVLVADLDFSRRELWGRLFPFTKQRCPTTYGELINN